MQIIAIAVPYTRAPLALRERIAFSADQLPDGLESVARSVTEGFILSTCNRTEIYAVAGHPDSGTRALLDTLARTRNVSVAHLEGAVDRYTHGDAVRHLFRVAAGLDSLVVGEEQILGQLKDAIHAARTAGALGPILSRLAADALAVGKAVRSRTGVATRPLSVVSLALREASARLGGEGLGGKRILVVGAGGTAQLVLRHLRSERPARVIVCNRTRSRGEALAAKYGHEFRPLDEIAASAVESDLVVMCVAASEPLLGAGQLGGATMSAEGRRRPLLIDLSLPRALAADVAAADFPTLDLDALETASRENERHRREAAAAAEPLIAAAVSRYLGWWHARQLAPTIREVLAHVERIRDRELERATRRGDLTGREREALASLSTRLVAQLMHEPLRALRTDPDADNLARALQRLFALSGASPVDAPDASSSLPADPASEQAPLTP